MIRLMWSFALPVAATHSAKRAAMFACVLMLCGACRRSPELLKSPYLRTPADRTIE